MNDMNVNIILELTNGKAGTTHMQLCFNWKLHCMLQLQGDAVLAKEDAAGARTELEANQVVLKMLHDQITLLTDEVETL